MLGIAQLVQTHEVTTSLFCFKSVVKTVELTVVDSLANRVPYLGKKKKKNPEIKNKKKINKKRRTSVYLIL